MLTRPHACRLAILSAVLAVPYSSLAAPVLYSTSSAGGPTNFDALIWSPAGTPGADSLDVANFNNTSALTASLNGSRSLGSIGRTNISSTTLNQTNPDDTITLNSAGTGVTTGLGQAQLLKAGSGSISINAPIVLGANATWANTSTSSNILTVAGTVTDGASSFSLTKVGAGNIRVNPGSSAIVGGVTHDGGTRVEAGSLLWGDGSSTTSSTISFGTGALDLTGGVFDVQWGGGYTLSNALLGNGGTINSRRGDGHKIAGGIALKSQITLQTGGGGGTPAFDVNSTVTLDQATAGPRRLISNIGGNGAGYVSGNIVDAAGPQSNALTVRVIGSRNLEIRGTGNAYDGGTVVESAASGQTQRTLVVAATSNMGAGDVTVQAQAGTIPAIGNNSYAGMLQLNGNTNIASTATLTIESGGLVTLNYTNTLVGSEDASDLLLSGLVLGGLAQPAGVYNATTHPSFLRGTGEIVVIPEPTTLSLLAMGAVGLTRRRRV